MKSADDGIKELLEIVGPEHKTLAIGIISIVHDEAYKAGQEATMRWVSEECKRMLASIPVEHHHAE